MLQVSYLSFGYFLFYFERLVFTCVLWFYFLCLFLFLLLFFSALPHLFPLVPSSHLCLTYQSTACAYTYSLAFPSVYHHMTLCLLSLFVCFISAVTFAAECDEQPVFCFIHTVYLPVFGSQFDTQLVNLYLNCVRTLEQPEETHKGTKTTSNLEIVTMGIVKHAFISSFFACLIWSVQCPWVFWKALLIENVLFFIITITLRSANQRGSALKWHSL